MARKPNSSPQTCRLLVAMLQKPRTWQYGYELWKETKLSSGTLYPLLIRLCDQGLLDSQWQDAERPGRPPRHAYRLTSEGLALARTKAQRDQAPVLQPRAAGEAT